MKLTYSFNYNKEELCMNTDNFFLAEDLNLECRINCIFIFIKKLDKPINGKSFDYQLAASVTLIQKPYQNSIYEIKFRHIYINDDRPGYPDEDQVKDYFKKKYSHLCINMLITTLKDREKRKKKESAFAQFHRERLKEMGFN